MKGTLYTTGTTEVNAFLRAKIDGLRLLGFDVLLDQTSYRAKLYIKGDCLLSRAYVADNIEPYGFAVQYVDRMADAWRLYMTSNYTHAL